MPVDVTIICACYNALPEGAALEEALQEAVEAAEALGLLSGTLNADGTCNYECVPTEKDPYFQNPTAVSAVVPHRQILSRRRLDFSDINPNALRRGIQTMQLVLQAIERNQLVAIALPNQGEL